MIREVKALCVECQEPGCLDLSPPALRADRAYELAFFRGWRKVDGRWLCPQHHGKPPGSFTAQDAHDAFGEHLTDAQRELADLSRETK